MDFNITNYAVLRLGGLEIWITETIVTTWIIGGALIAFALAARIGLRKFGDVPSGFQNVVEALVEAFDKLVRDNVGDKMMFLGNWFFMVFAFVLCSNLSGLFRLRPPTADWTMTFALALSTFALIHAMGARYRKGQYVKALFEPHFLFFPLNVIGELARPISLSFRLFGNILAGMILMALIYGLTPVFVRFVVPIPIHIFFDLFAGSLQTYVFCSLSLAFIDASASAE